VKRRTKANAVAALFVDDSSNGVYPRLLGAEWCMGETHDHDARTYSGPWPVVAHPPCNLWVNMAAVNWKRYGRQRPAWYEGGSDGGRFAAALRAVRTYGGVLEHPASTHAWAHYGLPVGEISHVGWVEHVGVEGGPRVCWSCEVWQSAYGHKARKRTWLLYCGKRPPFELRWERNPGTHQVGWFDRNKPTVGKREASATPEAFAQELIRLAEWSVRTR